MSNHEQTARTVYSRSAVDYASAVGTVVSAAFETATDVAQLDAFAAECPEGGLVVDAGCGSGRVARLLADRTLEVLGTDIAPGMIDVARHAHPDLRFEVAPLTQLPIRAQHAAGVVFWYSIIATPPAALDVVWVELRRVLVDGGRALVGFQSGDGEAVYRPDAYGTDTTLTLYRHSIDVITAGLDGAGLEVTTVASRAPRFEHETTRQAFVHARA
ncbi:MAG: class I SAM-dependent methyltransferase [Actinomycetota bacterium]